jgi:hypothetical protein
MENGTRKRIFEFGRVGTWLSQNFLFGSIYYRWEAAPLTDAASFYLLSVCRPCWSLFFAFTLAGLQLL